MSSVHIRHPEVLTVCLTTPSFSNLPTRVALAQTFPTAKQVQQLHQIRHFERGGLVPVKENDNLLLYVFDRRSRDIDLSINPERATMNATRFVAKLHGPFVAVNREAAGSSLQQTNDGGYAILGLGVLNGLTYLSKTDEYGIVE